MQPTYCPLPFHGLFVEPGENNKSYFSPCCKTKCRVLSDTVENYQTSVALKNLQQQFSSGEKPTVCRRCWDDESAGIVSKRQYALEFHPADAVGITTAQFTFSNACNLSCATCSPVSSSKWANEIHKYSASTRILKIHKPVGKTDQALESILRNLDNITEIEIAGGEPFYAATANLQLLNTVLPRADKILLRYITNGTIFPDIATIEILSKFKTLDIQISVDGTEKMFEYLRWPAQWNNVLANIHKFKSFIDRKPGSRLSIGCTVSIFNVFTLPEFDGWVKKTIGVTPYYGMISTNPQYSIKVLPQSIKKSVSTMLINENLQHISKFMMAEDKSELLPKTLEWIDNFRDIRNLALSDYCPDLYSALRGESLEFLELSNEVNR